MLPLVFGVLLLVAGAVSPAILRWVASREGPLDKRWDAVAFILAGDGVSGTRDGNATQGRFSDPFGVASAGGSIYVADAGDAQRIRRITSNGVVSTLAGGEMGFADGTGAAARFSTPSGLAADANHALYVADTGNNAIRRITPEGVVTTIAGDGVAGYRDGLAHEARFNGPLGVAVQPTGRVIVADTYNDRIRAIRADGIVVTVAGSGKRGPLDGAASEAQFDTPSGVTVDPTGNIYVADTGNGAVRMVSAAGIVSTIGPLPEDGLFHPIGIAIDETGVLYVTDERGRIVEITPGTGSRPLAGSSPGFANGSGTEARFRAVTGLALAARGRLIVTDPRNALVRLVAARSRVEPRLPPSPWMNPGFEVTAFARTPLLWPVDPMGGPFEIVGTIGEKRGGDGYERLHAGIDVRALEGTYVRAVRDGVVSMPVSTGAFGTLDESIRVGPIAYVHVRVGRRRHDEVIDLSRFVPTHDSHGRMVDMRVKRGARFSTGEAVGTINRFNHVHLNIGWPGEGYNPLRFGLVQFEDTIAPTIPRGGVRLYGEDGHPIVVRRSGRLIVGGGVRVVVDAWDQVDGNEPRRRLGLYRLGYQVLTRDGTPAPGFEVPRETMRFDRFAGDADVARMVYASGIDTSSYRRRSTQFLYEVTNTFLDGVASAGIWNASTLPPGDYTLRILAADIRGNQALTNRDLAVTVVTPHAD